MRRYSKVSDVEKLVFLVKSVVAGVALGTLFVGATSFVVPATIPFASASALLGSVFGGAVGIYVVYHDDSASRKC